MVRRWSGFSPHHVRFWVAVVGFVGASALFPCVAHAHDDGDTRIRGIVNVEDGFIPAGAYDDPFNGYRVFLSSPRHVDSGSRGECRNPGFEENVNGRQWNWRAANGNYYAGVDSPTSHYRNLHARGYIVRVSKNSRDGDLANTLELSRNFGASMHVVVHSNAVSSGCHSPTNYNLVMWEHNVGARDDRGLADAFKGYTLPNLPGGDSMIQRTNLAELERNAPAGDAYIEIMFHTSQAAQTWLHDSSYLRQYHMGVAVDLYLDYPN